MKNKSRFNDQGFTLIELLIVILILAILAIVGITQYVNYTKDSKDSTTRSNLQIMRRGLTNANAFLRTRCGYTGSNWPAITTLKDNDITDNTYCDTTLDVPVLSDRKIFGNEIPANPWSGNPSCLFIGQTDTVAGAASPTGCGTAYANGVEECTGGGCTTKSTECIGGGARTTASTGWCYNPANGEIWANTSLNDGGAGTGGNEFTF